MDGALIPEVMQLLRLAGMVAMLFGGIAVCLSLMIDQIAEGLDL